jgi:hypothetical protein
MIHLLALIPNTVAPEVTEDIISKLTLAFKGVRGLGSIRISEGHIMSPGGPPPYSKVIEVSFDSLESLMAWVQTPAAQADKELAGSLGIVRIFYEVKEL